ncbi:hypothetical protein BD626DRAFT_586203 [Schizophyllum amplum]|uniref:Uncharacterized protein n=1 Tax=Schizophyllum amplum TaxID=97359 RepID=A0A550C0X4_9AGAR|nr:hypothetical protein BD626DRAFT_586203 [Auriculariopsis ampla]
MVTGGPCAVCSRWAGFPPCTSDLSTSLSLQEQCLAELRSDRHTHKNWSLTGSSKRFFLPSEVSFWVPYYADVADICRKQKWQPSNCRTVEGPYPTYIKRRGCRFLLDDLNSAMSDVCSLDLDASYLEVEHAPWSLSDWHRENKLSKVLAINYKERANAHGALETIYWAILEWHRQSYEAGKSIRKANLAVLATIAEDRGTTLEAVQKDDRTQRVLAAFSRDLEHVSLSTFHYLPPVEKDRRKCNTRNPRADPKKLGGSGVDVPTNDVSKVPQRRSRTFRDLVGSQEAPEGKTLRVAAQYQITTLYAYLHYDIYYSNLESPLPSSRTEKSGVRR